MGLFSLLISCLSLYRWVSAAPSLGLHLDRVPTPDDKDRSFGSTLLTALAFQRKFNSKVEIFYGENTTCKDVECTKVAVKGVLGEDFDWRKVEVKAEADLNDGKRFDAFFSNGKDNIPMLSGRGDILNIYFYSHEHLNRTGTIGHAIGHVIRENVAFLRDKNAQEVKKEIDRFASYDLIFIPSPRIHDVFLRASQRLYSLCHKLLSFCPSVATHHIAGNMYDDPKEDIRTNSHTREQLSQDLTTIIWRAMQMKPFKETVHRLYPQYRRRSAAKLNDAKQCSKVCEGNCNCKHIALIVEPSLNTYFEFAVRTVVHQLTSTSKHQWNIHVMHSEANAHFVHTVLRDLDKAGKIEFSLIPVDVHVVGDYNQMTKKTLFWERYSQEGAKVLLFQSDTVMLGNATSIDDFLEVDYVGAPWHNEWNDNLNAARALPGGYFKAGVGNGGFSLRSGDVMYYIAKHFGSSSPGNEQEDMFFVKKMEILQREKEAQNFSSPQPSPP